MPDITNAAVDSLAGDIDAPYGPLVRVTNMDELPVPNDNIKLDFTTAVSGVTVSMTYNELADELVAADIIAQAFNQQGVLEAFATALDTYNTAIQALSLPHTYADFKTAYSGLRTLAIQLGMHNA